MRFINTISELTENASDPPRTATGLIQSKNWIGGIKNSYEPFNRPAGKVSSFGEARQIAFKSIIFYEVNLSKYKLRTRCECGEKKKHYCRQLTLLR